MPPRISISIINYRTAGMTLDCVRSVLADIERADLGADAVQIVVIDNNSGDGSAEEIEAWIAAQDPPVPVTLIKSPDNSGYSGGHNHGLGAIHADSYLILNSDALLKPGFLTAMSEALDRHPEAGLIVPRLEGEDGVGQINCFRFASPFSELIRGAQTGPVTKLLKRHEVALTLEPEDRQIEWASFACILLNGRMVKEIGPMDEGYFLYYEDSEYCLRARRAGWSIIRAPEAVAIHFRGGSGPVKELARARKRAPEYYYRSRSRFLTQAHGKAGLLAANLAWYLGRGIAQARRLLGKPVPRATEHETRDLWIGAGNPLAPFRPKG